MSDPVKETPTAHAAFEAYWSQGAGRSLASVGHALGKSTALMERWSRAHHWQARVIARQDQLAAEQERVRRESREAAVERHDASLVSMGEEGEALAFAVLKARAESGQMGAVAAVQFLTLAAKLALRGYREPESITRNEHTGAHGGPVEIAEATDEPLLGRLAQLAARLGAAGVAREPDGPGAPGPPA